MRDEEENDMASFVLFTLILLLPGGNADVHSHESSDAALGRGIWGTNGTSIIAPGGIKPGK